MEFTYGRLWLVILILHLVQDFQLAGSQPGFTKVVEFRIPHLREYFKYVSPISNRNLARAICDRRNFELAKMDFQQFYDGVHKKMITVDYKYWLDIETTLTSGFRFRNGSTYSGSVTAKSPPKSRQYCAYVRKESSVLAVYADVCELKKFAILQPSCASAVCPPQVSTTRKTWYEAKDPVVVKADLYSDIPHQITDVLVESSGYWIDLSRMRYQYEYPVGKQDVPIFFWETNEPDGVGNNDLCVISNENGKWMDSPCTAVRDIHVLCFNESRMTTLTTPPTTPSTIISTTTSSTVPTTTDTTTTTTTTTTTPMPITTKSSTTTTTTEPSTTTTRNSQTIIKSQESSGGISDDVQMAFIAGAVGLVCFILLLSAVLALMVSKYRSWRRSSGASSVSQSTFTMAEKRSSTSTNPYNPSYASNFNIYTSHRYQPRTGISSKLYKADEAYLKNSILRNTFGYPSRHNMALPPPSTTGRTFTY